MSEFLWFGTILGAVVGSLHACYTLSTRIKQSRLPPLKSAWQSIWTFVLWTLFGAYVTAFWIVGILCLAGSRLFGKRPASA